MPGLLYRIARQAISMDDGLMCYAIMLPAMGIFKITGKHNLCYQCFLSLAKLLSSSEAVAKALIGNITMSLKGRPFHNIGVDEGLEDLQGLTKIGAGIKWQPTKAMVHTACGFFLEAVRTNLSTLTKGGGDGEKAASGRHVQEAHADTYAIANNLRPMKLFAFDASKPRAFKDLNVRRVE